MSKPPRVFVSYSHDSEMHKSWVVKLATRLRENGIDAVLDQWDLSPGKDLTLFMEHGISSSNRVLVVCTEIYAEKANGGHGGVGYEKLILSGELVQNLETSKFIPLLRSSFRPVPIPRFLGTRLYIDFTDDLSFDRNYDSLLREIYGEPIVKKPVLGVSPFLKKNKTSNLPAKPRSNSDVKPKSPKSDRSGALFVLTSWLDSGGPTLEIVSQVHEWLVLHGDTLDAGHLLVAWLNQGGATEEIAPYLHKWLCLHGATQDANFVIVAWLKSGGLREEVAPYMHQWLHRFRGT